MKKIDELFNRFKKIIDAGAINREMVSEAIYKVIGVKIDIIKIQIKNSEILVLDGAGLKSKIFVSKQKILAILEEKAPGKFKNIR